MLFFNLYNFIIIINKMRGNFILYFLELVIAITSGVVMFVDKKVDLERSLLVILVGALLHGLVGLGLVCSTYRRNWIMLGLSGIVAAIAGIALGIVYSADDVAEKPLAQGWKYAVLGGALALPVFNLLLVGSGDNLTCSGQKNCLKGDMQLVKNAIRDYRAYEEGQTKVSALSQPVNVEKELNKYPELQSLQADATDIIGDEVGLDCKKFADLIKKQLLQNKKKAAKEKLTGLQDQLGKARAAPQPLLDDSQRRAAQREMLARQQRALLQQQALGDVQMKEMKA